MKAFAKLVAILGALVGLALWVFSQRKPIPPKNFTVVDDKTVKTTDGVELAVPPGAKSSEVVSAAAVPKAEIAKEAIAVAFKEPTTTPVPATEEKSAGELLFGPRKG